MSFCFPPSQPLEGKTQSTKNRPPKKFPAISPALILPRMVRASDPIIRGAQIHLTDVEVDGRGFPGENSAAHRFFLRVFWGYQKTIYFPNMKGCNLLPKNPGPMCSWVIHVYIGRGFENGCFTQKTPAMNWNCFFVVGWLLFFWSLSEVLWDGILSWELDQKMSSSSRSPSPILWEKMVPWKFSVGTTLTDWDHILKKWKDVGHSHSIGPIVPIPCLKKVLFWYVLIGHPKFQKLFSIQQFLWQTKMRLSTHGCKNVGTASVYLLNWSIIQHNSCPDLSQFLLLWFPAACKFVKSVKALKEKLMLKTMPSPKKL